MNTRAKPNRHQDAVHGDRITLDVLDPGHADPDYWTRFQARVIYLAVPELARRRAARQPSIGDVLASWWRLLIPASAVAAVAMATLLMPAEATIGPDIALEEALVSGFDDEPLPAVLVADQVDEVAFLVALEGA